MVRVASQGPLSASVGDYLKAVREVAGTGSASTNELSGRLSVSPTSVTNMLKRLRGMGLVKYEPYRGASLTEEGRAEALRLVRRHRLIEAFLIEYLGYSWQEVHDEAERLEHAVSDGFTERLAELLGHPERDPHGAPIPAPDGTVAPDDFRTLAEAGLGERVCILRVENEDTDILTYLGEHGLVPERRLQVMETRALDGVVTVKDEDGVSHSLGPYLSNSVFVQTLSP